MTVVITAARADAVERVLLACSAQSLGRRFFLGGAPDPREVWRRYRKFLLAGQALLAWTGGAPAGLLNLVPGEPGVAELGVLIADPWQRRGIGTRLAETAWQSARDVAPTVRATVRADNEPALAFLARQGFCRVASFDGQHEYELRVPAAVLGRV